MHEIINYLNQVDTSVFLYLNGFHNQYWDYFMTMYSSRFVWVPFYASFLYVMIRNLHIKVTIASLLVIVAIIFICDQTIDHTQADGGTNETKQPRQSNLSMGTRGVQQSRWKIWLSLLSCRQRMEHGILRNVSRQKEQAHAVSLRMGIADDLLAHLSGRTLSRRYLGRNPHRIHCCHRQLLPLQVLRQVIHQSV